MPCLVDPVVVVIGPSLPTMAAFGRVTMLPIKTDESCWASESKKTHDCTNALELFLS
jgi:hypothetical protein